jgi:hypothetical protein
MFVNVPSISANVVAGRMKWALRAAGAAKWPHVHVERRVRAEALGGVGQLVAQHEEDAAVRRGLVQPARRVGAARALEAEELHPVHVGRAVRPQRQRGEAGKDHLLARLAAVDARAAAHHVHHAAQGAGVLVGHEGRDHRPRVAHRHVAQGAGQAGQRVGPRNADQPVAVAARGGPRCGPRG